VGRVLGALMLAGLTLEFVLQGWIWHCPDAFSFAFFFILQHRPCCNATKTTVQLRTVVLFCTHLLSPPPSEKVDLPPTERLGAFFLIFNHSDWFLLCFLIKNNYF
jgi:hypothetical protein